jgi:peptide/nickel transport system substrate-binding protein
VRSRRSAVALVVLGVGLALSLGAEDVPGKTGRDGGTLLVITPPPPNGFGGTGSSSLDPALTPVQEGSRPWVIWYATCATLMAFPDRPAPEGLIPKPEAAVGPPAISRDRRTYVFRVRRGLRFSDGSPLTARNFARALGRVLNPLMGSTGAFLFSDVRRVSVRGLALRIELTKPSGDLTTRLALPFACPVPPGFPVDPAGVDLTGVGSGPYYIARYVPDSVIVLKRSRYYRGSRPHHVDRVVVRIGGDIDDDIKAVEDGRADVLLFAIASERRTGLAQRYRVNKRQLFRIRGRYTGALVLNTSGALFTNNAALRRAVNFALDRPEIVRTIPSGSLSRTPTDQVMPSEVPGWRDYRLYPVTGADLGRARKLARGNLRGGKAILWTIAGPRFPPQAQVVVSNLRAIGLDVEVKVMSADVMNARAGIPGAPYDMILAEFPLDYPDPANALVRLLGGQNARKPSGNDNFAYLDEPAYNRQMAAADRLTGRARFRAFSRLDAEIMRNQAPWAPLYEDSVWLLVSKRVACLRLQPEVIEDYAAMCLR